MSRYKVYPEYKDSGVEWLEPIPCHWEIKKLKFIANVQPSNVDKKTKEGETPVLLCNYTDVYYNDSVDLSIEFMKASATVDQIEKFTLKAGDIIITKDSEDPTDIAIPTFVPEDMPGIVCGYHLSIIRSFKNQYSAYIKRVFESNYANAYFTTRSNGLTRYGLGTYPLENVYFPKPSEDEAIFIANFLDHETAKIDSLIKKQRQLIKLLKEKRQAVISHAVTKGLDPEVPMKDSGVEWLGEVPEHWGIINSKWLFEERNVKAFPDEEMLTASQKYGVISQKKFMILEQQKVVQVLKGHNILKHAEANDFVISMRSFQGGIEYCPISGSISSAYVPLEPRESVNTDFFKYLFKSRSYIQALQSTTNLVRDGQALRYSNFIQVLLPIVPESEQEKIAEFIAFEITRMDELVKKGEKSISLMKERRTALISAAVTGKIDVWDWKKPGDIT